MACGLTVVVQLPPLINLPAGRRFKPQGSGEASCVASTQAKRLRQSREELTSISVTEINGVNVRRQVHQSLTEPMITEERLRLIAFFFLNCDWSHSNQIKHTLERTSAIGKDSGSNQWTGDCLFGVMLWFRKKEHSGDFCWCRGFIFFSGAPDHLVTICWKGGSWKLPCENRKVKCH